VEGDPFSREGGSPSPIGSAEEISGDGPLPSQGHADFATAAQKLAGLVPATTGWTPDQFWKATPAELAAIFAVFAGNDAGHHAAVPLDSAQLERLKEIYPDG